MPKQVYVKICELEDCGKEYTTTREVQRFCSKRCVSIYASRQPKKKRDGYRRHALNRWNNPEKRAAWLAASVSDEANQKRHDTQVGKIPNWSEEGKAKLLEVAKSKRGKPLAESTRQQLRDAQLRIWSDPEYKEMMSKKRKKWCDAHPDEMRKFAVQGCLSQAENNGPNSLECALYNALDTLGIEYIPQHPMFDKFVVDAYLPQCNTVIEANGTYWHADPTVYGPNKKKMNKTQQLRLAQDASKAKYLEKKGCGLIVLWERDKENFVQMLKCKLNID